MGFRSAHGVALWIESSWGLVRGVESSRGLVRGVGSSFVAFGAWGAREVYAEHRELEYLHGRNLRKSHKFISFDVLINK